MRILAGHEFASAGIVTVLGASPVMDDALLHRMVFIREDQRYPDTGSWPAFQIQHALRAASWFYPNWDGELAEALLADFSLPAGRAVKRLSRGMRSALGIVLGLAARAKVTLFDEPYAGLDPVARQLFYERLLADYAEHPRTVLLSTHLRTRLGLDAGYLSRLIRGLENDGLVRMVVPPHDGRLRVAQLTPSPAHPRTRRRRDPPRLGGEYGPRARPGQATGQRPGNPGRRARPERDPAGHPTGPDPGDPALPHQRLRRDSRLWRGRAHSPVVREALAPAPPAG
jgi:hypothetical protein